MDNQQKLKKYKVYQMKSSEGTSIRYRINESNSWKYLLFRSVLSFADKNPKIQSNYITSPKSHRNIL
jgi:hypothetical protein